MSLALIFGVSRYKSFDLQGTAGPVVDLLKGELNYTGPIDLPQYYVEKIEIKDKFQSSDMSKKQNTAKKSCNKMLGQSTL